MTERRLAIVTGAASGIGQGIARHFLDKGFRVAGLDIHPPPPDAGGFDDALTSFVGDASQENTWNETIASIVSSLGPPDILVNAAGISPRAQPNPTCAQAWSDILRINLISCWLGMRAVLPHMTARRSGRIVNIGALAAQHPFSSPNIGGYSASKAGIEAITRSTALEVAGFGISVNCVAPGPIDTPMSATMSEKSRAAILARVPMGRVGTIEEVATLVGFLSSAQCGFVTGQVIEMDGGLSVCALDGPLL